MARDLTAKQSAFVAEYLRNGGNASAAYRLVYNSKSNRSVIGVAASKLARSPSVAAAIRHARGLGREIASGEVANRYAVDQAAIASALARLSFANITDVCSLETERGEDGKPGVQRLRVRDFSLLDHNSTFAIAEVEQHADGRVRVKMYDKRQALVNLAQVMGLITDKGQVATDPVTGKPVDRFQPVVLQVIRK